MASLLRPLCLILVLAHGLDAAYAGQSDVSLGGFICVRPFSPECADHPDGLQPGEGVAACERQLAEFVSATKAYRDCLEGQISRAMRRANDVLDRFHCLTQHQRCPSP